jgi:hypothetical protein
VGGERAFVSGALVGREHGYGRVIAQEGGVGLLGVRRTSECGLGNLLIDAGAGDLLEEVGALFRAGLQKCGEVALRE